MNIATLLRKSATVFADRPAIALGSSIIYSYQELFDWAGRLAAGIRQVHGIELGDRVAIFMKNVPDYLMTLFAIWHAGAVAVPINCKLHSKECLYILKHSGSRMCFTSSDSALDLEAETERNFPVVPTDSPSFDLLFNASPIPVTHRAPTDLAWLFYTSGTTGKPKGAMLTHRNLLAAIMNFYADMQCIAEEDVILHVAPMSHGSGLYALPYVAKGALNVMPESAGFSPQETFELIEHYKASSLFLAPTMVMRMVNAPATEKRNAANLKAIFYGGGPMYVQDLLRALAQFGPKLIQLYGQGEAPMTITALSRRMHMDDGHPRYEARLASAGVPRTGVEVNVVDSDGEDLPAGEQGEIVVSGDVVMVGYWKDTEATLKTLRDGRLFTGDIGVFDENGFLTLLDRSKDVIISGGSNIYPREVEDVLMKQGSLLECSVIGAPHPDWGEAVVAFVVLKPGHTIDTKALDSFCLEHIARFKRPKRYVELIQLPKNNYGKILKTELREQLGELHQRSPHD